MVNIKPLVEKFLMRKDWAIDYTNFSTSFPQAAIRYKAYGISVSICFPQFTQCDRALDPPPIKVLRVSKYSVF